MGWWNGKFTRYEVYFGYPDHNGSSELLWIHMPKHDSKRSASLATSHARDKSKEHNIYVRVVDAETRKCQAMFFNGEVVDFTLAGDPSPHATVESEIRVEREQLKGITGPGLA